MTAAPGDAALLALAARLLAAAGRGPPESLLPLDGGKNNRVFRVAVSGTADPLALKVYFSDPRDPRDRRAAEWRFLTHAWGRGVRAIPEPLATEPASHAALYGFVAGRKLAPGAVAQVHIDAALAFIAALNPPARDASVLAPASEACFSLAEHLATVDRRVARLDGLDPEAPLRADAASFVERRLRPAWTHVRRRIEAAGALLAEPIEPAEQCLSPSDFGFHNALVDAAGRVTFLDFEYAGRDDPAKLVSDFFCCPEIPVPAAAHARFVAALAERLALGPGFVRRAGLLLDAYRVKWTCIILNEFLALGAARRAFAAAGERERRNALQLAKAEASLAALGAA